MTTEQYIEKFGPLPIKPALYDDAEVVVSIDRVKTVDLDSVSDGVKEVEFSITATIGDLTTSQTHTLDIPEEFLKNQESFVPYSELTEAMMLQWIEENKPMIHLKYSVVNRFKQETGPVAKEKALPWGSQSN